jgi:spermidine synthase
MDVLYDKSFKAFAAISSMKRLLTFSLVVLGISSVMSQLIVMREFLAVFGGNELTIGVILGNWTLLTGIGSYLGKRIPRKLKVLSVSQVGVGILPVLQLSLLRITKNLLFIRGEIANLTEIFAWSLVLLAPFCLLAGSFLIVACNLYSEKRRASDIGKVYLIDSFGDITGGALFSFVLIYVFNQFQVAYVIFGLNLVLSFLVSLSIKSKLGYLSLGVLLLSGIVFFSLDLNEVTTQELYEGQHIVYQKNSLYGHIVVTETNGQITVFENNVPFFSTQDITATEETVHYTMVQTDKPDLQVLLIGGGASGTVQEVLKYAAAVDYVELDPDIIEMGRRYTSNLECARIFEMDGRQYVKETDVVYDVIILDVPDPDSAQLNRFYTVEFFGEIRNILRKDGIFSLSLSTSPNYVGKPTRELNSSIYKSLKSVFANVIIIPGNRNFFVASDTELTYDIAERIEEKDIPTEYVNKYYLSGTLTEDRISMVSESVTENVSVNSDFKPEAYYYYIVFWIDQFRGHFLMFLIGLAVLVMILLAKIAPHPVPFAVFTTGFAGTALEVVLVLGFQILYGYVYSQVGVLITSFLVGLLIGAFYVNRTLKRYSKRSLVYLEFLVIAFSVGVALSLPHMMKIGFPVVTALLGALVGAEFPMASKLYYQDVHVTAAALYSADLLGGCLGALLVSTILVPFLGVVLVCILVGGLNVLSGLILLKEN